MPSFGPSQTDITFRMSCEECGETLRQGGNVSGCVVWCNECVEYWHLKIDLEELSDKEVRAEKSRHREFMDRALEEHDPNIPLDGSAIDPEEYR